MIKSDAWLYTVLEQFINKLVVIGDTVWVRRGTVTGRQKSAPRQGEAVVIAIQLLHKEKTCCTESNLTFRVLL